MCKPKGTNPNGHDRCSSHVREEIIKREKDVGYLLRDEMRRYRTTPAWLEKINKSNTDLQETLLDYAGTPEGAAAAYHLSTMTSLDDIRVALGENNDLVDRVRKFFPEEMPEGHKWDDPADPRNVIHQMGAVARRAILLKYYYHCGEGGALSSANRSVQERQEMFDQASDEATRAEAAKSLQNAQLTREEVAGFLAKVKVEAEQGVAPERITQWRDEFLPSDATREAKAHVDSFIEEAHHLTKDTLKTHNPHAREIFVAELERDRIVEEDRRSVKPADEDRLTELYGHISDLQEAWWRQKQQSDGPLGYSSEDGLGKGVLNALHGLAALSDGRTAYISASISAKHQQENKKSLGGILSRLVKR